MGMVEHDPGVMMLTGVRMNHWMRRVSTRTTANGAAVIISETRLPAVHCSRTSSAR
jgi:hypothetical protein